jgi:hypothetical protein
MSKSKPGTVPRRRFALGDRVKEIGGSDKIGTVVHHFSEPSLADVVVVQFGMHGYAYHVDELVRVTRAC